MHEGKPSDSQTPFIKTVLGFLGLHDVRIVYAEGLAMGDDAKTESFQRFTKNLTALV
jgi:FMN-dependent NADH-azoreductase